MISREFRPKISYLIQALSLCFIFAPLGNLVFTLIFLKIPEWYRPSVFFSYASVISWPDRVLNLLVFLSGVLLLIRRKSAWLAAMVSLILISGFNLYGTVLGRDPQPRSVSHSILALVCSAAVLLVFSRFKFPYLDRRDRWTHLSERVATSLEVTIGSHPEIAGTIRDLSSTGALIELPPESLSGFSQGQSVEILIRKAIRLECVVVRKSGKGLGVRFHGLSKEQREQLKALVR